MRWWSLDHAIGSPLLEVVQPRRSAPKWLDGGAHHGFGVRRGTPLVVVCSGEARLPSSLLRKEEESNPCPFGPDGFQDRSRATRVHLPVRRRQDLNLRTP